eukprot:764914-Hanusia_phi.AAC.2
MFSRRLKENEQPLQAPGMGSDMSLEGGGKEGKGREEPTRIKRVSLAEDGSWEGRGGEAVAGGGRGG